MLVKNPIVYTVLFATLIIAAIYSSKRVTDDRCATDRADSYFHLEDAKNLFSGNERILIISDYKMMGPNAYSMFMSLTHWSKNENIDLIYPKTPFPDFANDFDLTQYDKVYGMYMSESLLKQLKENFGEKFELLYKRNLYEMADIPVYTIVQ